MGSKKNGSAAPKLSKSQYCKGRKCLKRVWLYNHRRELAEAPGEFQQHLFDQGHEVGALARTCFPGGVLISEDHTQREAALANTEKAMKNGIQVLFEAAISFENILIRADVLKINEDGSVDLIEVKSTNSIKKEHLDDVAVQKYVLEGAGLRVASCSVMHLNPEYIRRGELDLDQLFVIESVNDAIKENVNDVKDYIELIRANLVLDQEPLADIGSVCKNPYKCEFYEHCWSHVTNDSIHILTRLSAKKRAALVDKSIELIRDIPEDFDLTENQQVQRKCAVTGDSHIELPNIQGLLDKLKWPIYFLDFETVQFAIPQFDGTSPYEHLTFQYSLHIQKEPGGPIAHKDFLSTASIDPRKSFSNQLCLDIPMDAGSVLVYYAAFERSKIMRLAELFPELDHHFKHIVDRLWDLETPFAKRWFYEHSFGGRSSIKVVLPALVPELSYLDLKIQKGDIAQARYLEMVTKNDHASKLQDIEELKAYCNRDTWAMVQILRVLLEIAGKENVLPKSAA